MALRMPAIARPLRRYDPVAKVHRFDLYRPWHSEHRELAGTRLVDHRRSRVRLATPSFELGAAFQIHRASSLHRLSGSPRSEEHTSELQSLMRISYAVFCLKKKNNI